MNFETWFREKHPEIVQQSVAAVLRLAGEGATIPFIARYRKEQTQNLDEVGIQAVIDQKERWDQLLHRQKFILEEINKQGKLTAELKAKIESAFQPDLLEDLYLPYKVKRKSKATLAREAGLEPLANWIWDCGHGLLQPEPGQTLEIWAFTFRNDEKGFKDVEACIQGGQDILVERLSEILELRQKVREALFQQGGAKTLKAEKAKTPSKFENYFDHWESVQSLLKPENSHRYLAMRRGWIEEELTLSIAGPIDDESFEARLQQEFEKAACTVPDSPGAAILLKAARLAFKVHVWHSIESEVQKALKEVADQAAIDVFAQNLRKILLASPMGSKATLGVDPGLRTGCKLAVVDESGKYIASSVIHLQTEEQKNRAKTLVVEIVKAGNIQAIAVGNGTAGRETEIFLRAAMKEANLPTSVVMVSEAGASVYSASEVAREEFPDLDVTVRGAISIARRLQDPLAELVKTDPKSIGVGQYQHDVSPHALKRTLTHVVESCVNSVGVNLNTASSHLLAHVSGIGEGLARGIIEYRTHKGLFKSRKELLEVPRFSQKAFEQGAGFLRIAGAENILDSTGVHPERYEDLEKIAGRLNRKISDLVGDGAKVLRQEKELREEIGPFTFDDIVAELEKPGRDPRETFVPFQFREDIHELKDLQVGMICPGIVTNVTNFGAFVDIGIHQDGLVHISQLSEKFIKDPKEAVSPGDHVQVKVLEVSLEKSQISLSIKQATEKPKAEKNRDTRGKNRNHPGRSQAKGDATVETSNPSSEAGQDSPRGKRSRRGPSRDRMALNPPPAADSGPRLPPIAPRQAPLPPTSHSGPSQRFAPKGPPKPKQIFNNAFAGLANLRDNLKK
jgi:uncharacterized protein